MEKSNQQDWGDSEDSGGLVFIVQLLIVFLYKVTLFVHWTVAVVVVAGMYRITGGHISPRYCFTIR